MKINSSSIAAAIALVIIVCILFRWWLVEYRLEALKKKYAKVLQDYIDVTRCTGDVYIIKLGEYVALLKIINSTDKEIIDRILTLDYGELCEEVHRLSQAIKPYKKAWKV